MTRNRGERQKKGETKKKIIEFISSTSSLFVEESEIRDFLKKNYDIREPKNIKKLLKDLSKKNLITKQEIQRGFDNIWGIENIIQIQKIFEEYKDVIKILQINEKITSMLIEKQLEQQSYLNLLDVIEVSESCKECLKYPLRPDDIRCNLNEKEREKCYDLNMENPPSDYRGTPKINDYIKNMEVSQEKLIATFKEHLMSSPHFFKMCLVKTPEELRDSFAIKQGIGDVLKYFDDIFAICVNTDIANNESNEKSIQYVADLKRRSFEVVGTRNDGWQSLKGD